MKGIKLLVAIFLSFFCFANNVQQTVMISILPNNSIEITGDSPLLATQVLAGQTGVQTVFSSGITYTFTSNDGTAKKVVAYLDANMPAGVSLSCYMSPPPGGKTMGMQPLTTAMTDLVRNISPCQTCANLSLTYELLVEGTAVATPMISRNVIYTLIDDS